MRRGVGVRLGATAVSAVLLAGACGSDSDETGATTTTGKESPAQVLLATATRTAESKTAKAAFSVALLGVPGLPGGNYTSTGEGSVDFAGRQAKFDVKLPPLGSVDFGRVESLSSGPTAYFKFTPEVAQSLRMGDRQWARIDIVDLSRASGVNLTTITQAAFVDPAQSVQLLRGAGADFTEVGKEEVRGDETTHYTGSVDMAVAASTAPPQQQPALRALAQILNQPLAGDVYVDPEGRLRKLVYTANLTRLNLPGTTAKCHGYPNPHHGVLRLRHVGRGPAPARGPGRRFRPGCESAAGWRLRTLG
jgi:hypothetical protein